MANRAKKLEGKYERSFRLNRDAINEDERTVQLSFSSEEPYERYFGTEVLGHEAGEVNMKRLASGTHPLLLQHDRDKQIGVITDARIDSKDKKGRATVRFSKSQLAQEIFDDVRDGIRSLVSVGYVVNRFKTKETLNDDGEVDHSKTIHRAVDWEPHEVSIVSIPADINVGIGKEFAPSKKENKMTEEERKAKEAAEKAASEAAEKAKREAEEAAKRKREADENQRIEIIREEEAKKADERLRELYAISNRFSAGELLNKALKEKWQVDKFRAAVMDNMTPQTIAQLEQGQGAGGIRTIGEQFVRSKQYAAHVAGSMPSARLECNGDFWSRATFDQGTEALTSIQKLPGVPGLLDQQPLRVAALFAQGVTSALTVRYIQEDSYTRGATAVAEDGTKPEATFNVSEVDATVEKMAVIGRVTDEMFADQPAMQAYVDERMRYMIESLEDDHLINGSGSSSQITGILNVSGIQTEDASASSTPADAIYKAVVKVRSVGFIEPTAIILHPNDERDLRLTKDSNGQYHGGGPFFGQYGQGMFSNVSSLWGLPLISTTSITEGTGLVGAFRTAAQIFRRSGLTMESTNSHDTDFVANRIAIRAEQRLTLATYKPLGFCSVTNIT